MGQIIATCGHLLSEEEGVGIPQFFYDGMYLSFITYCRDCISRLIPVYFLDLDSVYRLSDEKSKGCACGGNCSCENIDMWG